METLRSAFIGIGKNPANKPMETLTHKLRQKLEIGCQKVETCRRERQLSKS
jgi:hypothetical protein